MYRLFVWCFPKLFHHFAMSMHTHIQTYMHTYSTRMIFLSLKAVPLLPTLNGLFQCTHGILHYQYIFNRNCKNNNIKRKLSSTSINIKRNNFNYWWSCYAINLGAEIDSIKKTHITLILMVYDWNCWLLFVNLFANQINDVAI